MMFDFPLKHAGL